MKIIITIQHAQSTHHINGMVGSWTDWNLSETGFHQARRIAERLYDEFKGTQFSVYSSDLKRAMQTAEPIAEKFNTNVVARFELRERNLGICCGKSVAWLKENMTAPEMTVDDRLFPDAESRRDEWNRLRHFFDEVILDGEGNIIVVSHGDLLSVFNAMFIGLPTESLNSFEAFGMAGGVSLMRINDDGKRMIKKLSDMSYII